MNISDIISTPERVKILDYILEDPTRRISVTGVARELNLSKGLVSQYLHMLRESNISVKVEDKRFHINAENPSVRALKILLNLNKLNIDKIQKIKGLKGIGMYGSWAKGTNTKESDVDIWIKVKKHPSEEKIAKASAELGKRIGYDVRILVLSPERIERLKKEDPIFYHSLVFGSISLWGEELET